MISWLCHAEDTYETKFPPNAPLPWAAVGTFWGRLSFLLFLLIVTATSAAALTAPEKLVYDVTWTGIKAGTATQEIIDEGNAIRIVSTVRSADWISVFFPVEDRVESLLTKVPPPLLGLPETFRMKVREGKHRRDKEIIFDHGKGMARYIDHLNGEKLGEFST